MLETLSDQLNAIERTIEWLSARTETVMADADESERKPGALSFARAAALPQTRSSNSE